MKTLSYAQRLKILNLQTLELRRLLIDLVHCYKIIFGLLDVSCDDFFTLCQSSTTRGHSYKLYKAVVNLCVVCSLQTVLSMYGMV